MNMSLIITEGKYGDIDADYSSCHIYYIIKISSSTYTHQADLNIDCQVLSSVEKVCEGTYFFSINKNSNHYVLEKQIQ